MNKTLATLAVVLLATLTMPAHATFKKAIDANLKYDTDVVIYSSEDCNYCAQADEFLDQFGVTHKRISIDNNPEATAEMELFGGTSVPLMVVNGKVLQGFIKNHVYHTMVATDLIDAADYEK